MDFNITENKFTQINIGGTVYKCYTKTLKAFSSSILANLDKYNEAYDVGKNEYFFDRNPILFAFILDSFRKGAIHLPKDICGPTFRKELDFWKIPPHYVAPCCWEALYGGEDDIEIVQSLLGNIQKTRNIALMNEGKASLRTRLWLFLDEPKSSRPAYIWSVIIAFVILASILAESLSTLDVFQGEHTEQEMTAFKNFPDSVYFSNSTIERIRTLKPNTYLVLIIAILNAILTLELVIGFIVCPCKKTYVTCVSRVLACIGYIAFWVSNSILLNLQHVSSMYVVMIEVIFGYLSILKITRLFYISKNVPASRLILLTFKSTKEEMKILVFLLGICVFIYGYFLFAAEFLHNEKIDNIFKALYWALITLTTVGYGDYVPVTSVGHVIAGSCAVCGVIVLALPVGVIASKFYRYYSYFSSIKTNGIMEMNLSSDNIPETRDSDNKSEANSLLEKA